MKNLIQGAVAALFLLTSQFASGQTAVTLDSCRNMAVRNNKAIRIAEENIRGAGYTRSVARAAYLPAIDFTGTYLYNQHKLTLVEDNKYLPVFEFNPQAGTYVPKVVTGADGQPVMNPATGQPVFQEVALLPKSELVKDTHNIFALGFTLAQPVYMGGEIRAMNKIAKFNEEMNRSLRDQAIQDVTYSVDEAYWLVVSLSEKLNLARTYCKLIEDLRRNVGYMLEAGVATQSDLLQIDVKYNEAQLDLMKVENGLSLSRMALAEVCGLPLDSQLVLADESGSHEVTATEALPMLDMQQIYERRNDLGAMRAGISMLKGKEAVAKAAMLPKVALMASYLFTNPNLKDGFSNSFAGSFHVGATVTIPLWHWGGNYNKYRAARSQTAAQQLTLDLLEEKVELQVRQARFKYTEAFKTYEKALSAIANADRNLRNAEEGFKEGVLTMVDVTTAQTGWVKAYSEKIDAEIGIRLCRAYLSKVMGI